MAAVAFGKYDLLTVSEALDIAEDATGNFYRSSTDQWKNHPYDVKTLLSLRGDEISQRAFAVLNRGFRAVEVFEPKAKRRDYYFICLQDHRILEALRRDKDLRLLPLLVYILTHELVHIVRFCNFFQPFDAPREDMVKEEAIVHSITFKILENLKAPKINYVLDSYKGHRICEMVG